MEAKYTSFNTNDNNKNVLLWSNIALFLLHLALFITFWVISYQQDALSLTLPVYTSYIRLPRQLNQEDSETFRSSMLLPFYDTTTSGCYSIPMTFLILFFFFVSFSAHLFASLNILYKEGEAIYLQWIKNCRQPLRWLEYFLSAPPLIIVLAYLSGIRSAEMMLMLTALIATTMFYGWATEEMAIRDERRNDAWSKKQPTDTPLCNTIIRLFPFMFGCLPYGVAWAVIIFAFNTSIDRSRSNNINAPQPPDWVQSVVWIEFALYSSFAFVQLFQFSSDYGCKYYWVGELLYLVLSFASKATLGIFVAVFVILNSDDNTRRYFESIDGSNDVCR